MSKAFILVILLAAASLTGCAAGIQVGNFHTGGSLLCGSYDRADGERMVLRGCIEEAMHGGGE